MLVRLITLKPFKKPLKTFNFVYRQTDIKASRAASSQLKISLSTKSLHLTDEGDRGALIDGGYVAMSDLDCVLTPVRPLEDDQAGGRGRGCQPPQLHHATQRRQEVQIGHLNNNNNNNNKYF